MCTVVLTEKWKDILSPWLGNSIVIPNPVPDVPISSERERSSFLLMGRSNPMKGQDIAIEAIRILRSQGIEVTLHLAGFEHSEPGIVGHGWVSGEHKERLMSSCGTLLSPSKWEGLSMSVIESMARGMPVLASPASQDVFDKSGRVVELNAVAFSEAMKEMMSGTTWQNMADAGPGEAEQYRLANVVPQWGLVYDEVMA